MAEEKAFIVSLFISLLLAYFIRRVPCSVRGSLSAFLGVGLISIVCGWKIFHSMFVVLINIVLIRFLPTMPMVNFVFCFAYLTFFRCAHLICGGCWAKFSGVANGVQLLMTLRCVGLAFELSDQRRSKTQRVPTGSNNQNVGVHFEELSDRPMRMFQYCYNLMGLITGPYYSYRTHQDMVRNEHLSKIPFSSEVFARLIKLLFLIPAFLALRKICPIEDVHTDAFYENNYFLTRLLYALPVCTWFRYRCYIAWMISESACIVAGLGAYPKVSKPKVGSGPSDLDAYSSIMKQYDASSKLDQSNLDKIEYDYETILNIDIYGAEFSHTFRGALRSWNRGVQYWLATYVYRRCPWKSVRTPLTMLVSAYWHGVHAGYYLSFMTIPLLLYAEDLGFSVMEEESKKKDADNSGENDGKFRQFWWFYWQRAWEQMDVAFLLLTWTSAMKYWSSVGFFVHVTLVIMIGVFWWMKKSRRLGKSKVMKVG